MKVYILIKTILILSIIYETNAQEGLQYAFAGHLVVPDVLDAAPDYLLEISYPSGARAELGNELTPSSVSQVPKLEWNTEAFDFEYGTETPALYTLCMIDPDAPSRALPLVRENKHWLVINIPGKDINAGKTLAAYQPPAPPKGTGPHRYVFVVYRQEQAIETTETPIGAQQTDGRMSFHIRDFAKKHNLGKPVAGNFFQAQTKLI